MQRCFDIDVLLCPHCLGRRRIIAFLEDPVVVHQILSHCGLLETGSDPPLPVPAELPEIPRRALKRSPVAATATSTPSPTPRQMPSQPCRSHKATPRPGPNDGLRT
jgi:hypothetical protein